MHWLRKMCKKVPSQGHRRVKYMERKPILIGIFAAAALIIGGCLLHYHSESANSEYSKTIFAMDTVMTLTAYGPNGEDAIDAAVSEVMRLDALLSTENVSSEVSMINFAGSGSLSADTKEILSRALDIYKETEGLFDITIYPIMELWGFPSGDYRVPTENEIEETLKLVDASQIVLSGDRVTLGERQKIDFGGIAKGYTSDRLMDIFAEYGVESAMVSLGGNVEVLGARPGGTPYRIGIQDPLGLQGELIGVVSVTNKAVITSGGYERYFEEGGQTYIHIMDPRTGRPAQSDLLSVTIVSSDGELADALSTSLFIMGFEDAQSFWRAHSADFEMVLIDKDSEIYVTSGLKANFETDEAITILDL